MLLLLCVSYLLLAPILISGHIIPTIYGGRRINTSQVPFVVRIQFRVHGIIAYCTGSLITKNAVLTAAHCTENQIPTDIFVFLGIDGPENEIERIYASEYISHPEYIGAPFLYNDIAIIFLEDEVRNLRFKPIQMDFSGVSYVKTGIVIGYGPHGILKMSKITMQKCLILEWLLCGEHFMEEVI